MTDHDADMYVEMRRWVARNVHPSSEDGRVWDDALTRMRKCIMRKNAIDEDAFQWLVQFPYRGWASHRR